MFCSSALPLCDRMTLLFSRNPSPCYHTSPKLRGVLAMFFLALYYSTKLLRFLAFSVSKASIKPFLQKLCEKSRCLALPRSVSSKKNNLPIGQDVSLCLALWLYGTSYSTVPCALFSLRSDSAVHVVRWCPNFLHSINPKTTYS